MSLTDHNFSVTFGDLMEGFFKYVFPYVMSELDSFKSVEPYEFNKILNEYLNYKRELTLDPNAVLTHREIKTLYNKFVEPDYYEEAATSVNSLKDYVKDNKLLNNLWNYKIADAGDEEIFINEVQNIKKEIDAEIIPEFHKKLGENDLNYNPKHQKSSNQALPFASVEKYETDDEILINEMREIPEDEVYITNPYLMNFNNDDDQGESVALYDEIIDVGNVDDYESIDDVEFTTMDDYRAKVKSEFTVPTHEDYFKPGALYYVKKYGVPLAFATALPFVAKGIHYGVTKTYDWYKNRMNSGTNKSSKDYSQTSKSGANIEDKIKINRLITGGNNVDAETRAKIRRLTIV